MPSAPNPAPDRVRGPARLALAALVLIAGLALRGMAARASHNFDMQSYEIVAAIHERGGNVYAQTPRYNYAPAWFHILGALRGLNDLAPRVPFRHVVAGFLSMADVFLFALLWRRAGLLAASLFFLNPVSIVITGLHRQFDNLALGVGLAGAFLLDGGPSRRRFAAGLFLVGLSLTTKHVLFLFPLWLAFRETTWPRRLAAAAVPPLLFLASFTPYLWDGGAAGIIRHVFLFRARFCAPLIAFFGVDVPWTAFWPFLPWLAALCLGAVFLRGRDIMTAFGAYTVLMVAFSPAMHNEYLAIPLAGISAAMNPVYAAYVGLSTLYLWHDVDALGVFRPEPITYPGRVPLYSGLAVVLALGFAWQFWAGPAVRRLAERVARKRWAA